MIVIDANVLIALWSRDIAHFARVSELFAQQESSLIHPVNLGEALVHAVRQGREQQASQHLAALGVHQAVVADTHAFALARARAETGLTMPDCCALVTAEELGLPLATVDRRLAQVARQRGLRVLPED